MWAESQISRKELLMKQVKITIIAKLDKDLIEIYQGQMTDKEILEQIKKQVKYSDLEKLPIFHTFEVKEVESL